MAEYAYEDTRFDVRDLVRIKPALVEKKYGSCTNSTSELIRAVHLIRAIDCCHTAVDKVCKADMAMHCLARYIWSVKTKHGNFLRLRNKQNDTYRSGEPKTSHADGDS